MTTDPDSTATRLNHVGIAVNDLDRSVALFEACFGFTLLSRGGRPPGMAARLTGVAGAEVEIAFVESPALLIELLAFTRSGAPAVLPAPTDSGAMHVALDVADIAAALDRGRDLGLRLLGEVMRIPAGPNAGGRVAYVCQDTGVTLELIEAPGGIA